MIKTFLNSQNETTIKSIFQLYYKSESKVLQYFGSMWGSIHHLWMLLLRSRWWTILDCEMLSLFDMLWMLLAGNTSMAWGTALESTVLGLPDLNWSLKFLQPEQNFLNHLVIEINYIFTFHTINRLLWNWFALFELIKRKFPN